MKILVLTGIAEELRPLKAVYDLEYLEKLGLYRSKKHALLFAATTGPGIAKRKNIYEWLTIMEPNVILNAGLVGLTKSAPERAIGSRLRLGTIVQQRPELYFPGGKGQDVLVTVERPIFEPWEKLDLYDRYGAIACDMEAAILMAIIAKNPKLTQECYVAFCKVIGDIPNQYELYKHEEKVRGWHYLNRRDKVKLAFEFPGGPFALIRLMNAKKKAVHGFQKEICHTIDRLLDGVHPFELDSVFVPH